MTLEKLSVVIDAQTAGLKRELNNVKSQVASMSTSVSQSLNVLPTSTKKITSKMRSDYVKELDKMIGMTEMKIAELEKAYGDTGARFGWDSKQNEAIGNQIDYWGDFYYKTLKKYREGVASGDIDFDESKLNEIPRTFEEITASVNEMQAQMNAAFDFKKILEDVKELAKVMQRLRTEIKSGATRNSRRSSLIIQAKTKELNDTMEQLKLMVQEYLNLKGITKEQFVSILAGKDKSAAKVISALDLQNPTTTPESQSSGKSIGYFAKALLGVRSIYMLIRKIVNQNGQLTQAIQNIFGTVGNILEPFLNLIASLMEGISNWLSKVFKVESGVKNNTDKFLANFDELNKIGDTETEIPSIKEAWDNMSSAGKIATITGSLVLLLSVVDKLKKLFESKFWVILLDKLKTIGAWIASNIQPILGIAVAVAGLVVTIQGIIDYLKDSTWENFGKTLSGIALVLAGIAVVIGSWPVLIAAAVTAVVSLISRFWEPINEFFQNVSNKLQETIDNSELGFGSIVAVVKSVWDAVWGILSGALNSIRQIIDGILQLFKGNFKEGLISIVKGIANAVITVINALINGINIIISPVQKIIQTMGDWLGTGWTGSKAKIPTIPYLAKGGIVDRPTVAMIGEAGREIVTPENLLRDIVTNGNGELANVMVQCCRQLINSIDNKDMQVSLDGTSIAKSVAKANNQYKLRTGEVLI